MIKPNFKLCILAAGRGTRNKSIAGLHKCLLPISNKPVISHILDNFDKNIKIVIALGHKTNQIKSYLEKIHADRDITYVNVENFEGQGSGPGLSLLACKEHLNQPFIFTAADTVIRMDEKFINFHENWIGSAKVLADDAYRYCLIKTKKDKIFDSFYYGCGIDSDIFTGIAGVYDYSNFWTSLKNSYHINGEHQVINGFDNLSNVKILNMDWHDTGNEESYTKAKEIFPNNLAIEKDNEAIYIDNDYVVKYFSNEEKSTNRIKRAYELSGLSPKIYKINNNMFCYNFINGKRLTDIQNEEILKYFFTDYNKHFRSKLDSFNKDQFDENCNLMYRKKTYDRIKTLIGSPIDNIEYINGTKVEKIESILNRINWNKINTLAIPSRYHGDLQPENILIDDNNKFYYIDWRESFGNSIDVGDAYYDLGKLYHALLISNELILSGNYDVDIKDKNNARISFSIKNNLNALLKYFKIYCEREGYIFKHVKLIGVLNYINIACLYSNFEDGRYCNFLFLLGKKMLTELLNESEGLYD